MEISYGLRACYIIVAWFALGGAISHSKDNTSYLASLMLFLVPLAFDYYNQQPIQKNNQKRRYIGMYSSLFLTSLFFGLMVADIGFEIPMIIKKIFWFIFSYYAGLSIYDWIGYSSKEETEFREKIRNLHRKKMHETFEDRVEYYIDAQGKKRKKTVTSKEKTGTEND